MRKRQRWMRGPVILTQSCCHRRRRAFQSEQYRISTLNLKVRAPASPSAWPASWVGTSVHRPDAPICQVLTRRAVVCKIWDSFILKVVSSAESPEIPFRRTKKKYVHCSIRIYDRYLLDRRLRTDGGRDFAGERSAISQGGFYCGSQDFAFRHYFARLPAETMRKRGCERSWAIFAQNGSRTTGRFVIRGS